MEPLEQASTEIKISEKLSDAVDISLPNGNERGNDYGNDNGNESKKNKVAILDAIRKRPKITLDELVIVTGKSKRTISRETKEMQEEGTLRRIGSARAGHWEATD